MRLRRYSLAVTVLLLAALLTGCGLLRNTPGGTSTAGGSVPAAANQGERQGTITQSRASKGRGPIEPASSPEMALERFADRYVNWTWRTLATDQEQLAAIAVGEARAGELQARQQTARDAPLRRAHIFNKGTIVAIARARGGGGEWVIDTREQTGGNGEYAELRSALHVTFAKLQPVPGGWAVSVWRPEL